MKLTAAWREHGPGVVTITPGGVGLVRLLGTPFAAAGLYFLYQFAGGVLHPGELTIAGWVMLPIFAALFLVPGWIILFGRKRTRLDVPRREATEEYDFLVYTRRKTTMIPPGAHVMLRYEEGSKSNTSVSSYAVHVYLDPGSAASSGRRGTVDLILLAMFGSKDHTAGLEFARRVAGLFGIDVQDRCVEGGEVNAAGIVVDRLDLDEAD